MINWLTRALRELREDLAGGPEQAPAEIQRAAEDFRALCADQARLRADAERVDGILADLEGPQTDLSADLGPEEP